MEHRKIGSLNVSVIGLGCNQLGTNCDQRQSEAVITRALEVGVNFFDTAEEYGDGQSETALGIALRGVRNKVVIATKFAGSFRGVRKPGQASATKTIESVESSLRRLQTDHIDLFQLHSPDPETPLKKTMGALDLLVRTGKVREIGCCNFADDQLDEASRHSS